MKNPLEMIENYFAGLDMHTEYFNLKKKSPEIYDELNLDQQRKSYGNLYYGTHYFTTLGAIAYSFISNDLNGGFLAIACAEAMRSNIRALFSKQKEINNLIFDNK